MQASRSEVNIGLSVSFSQVCLSLNGLSVSFIGLSICLSLLEVKSHHEGRAFGVPLLVHGQVEPQLLPHIHLVQGAGFTNVHLIPSSNPISNRPGPEQQFTLKPN